jgi:hypothetical protein
MIHVYAEYADVDTLVRAIGEVRARRDVRLEVYSPYPVPEIERALVAPRSRLAVPVLVAGLAAAAAAYGLQWLLNAYLYPLDVGGRPPHFPLAFVPITFEMGVLFAALTAFAVLAIGGGLFRLWHPSREVPGIESATAMHFWLEVWDPRAELTPAELVALLRDTGALTVHHLEVAP